MVGANGSIGRADPGLTTCPPAWRAAIRHNVNDHGSFLLWIGHTYEISRGRGDLSFVRHIRAVPRDRYCGAGLGGAAIRRMEDFMPTIAIVDDDRNILTSVSTALEIEGYRIMTYTDGCSALEGFDSDPPDLAILDIKMPRMDGLEMLRRLREKSKLPVIFLSSKDEEIDELFGLKMGADDFVRKPFSRSVLS